MKLHGVDDRLADVRDEQFRVSSYSAKACPVRRLRTDNAQVQPRAAKPGGDWNLTLDNVPRASDYRPENRWLSGKKIKPSCAAF